MKSQTSSAKQQTPTPSFGENKFVRIVEAIKFAYARTGNPGLERLDITAGPDGVVVTGEEGSLDEWWAKLIARDFSRGLPVVCKLRPKQSGKAEEAA